MPAKKKDLLEMTRIAPSETTPQPATWLQRNRFGLLIGLAISAGSGTVCLLDQFAVQSFPASIEAHRTLMTISRAASVKEITAKVGQAISTGDPLFQLVDAQLEDRLASKRREIAEVEAELSRAKATAEVEIAWRRRGIQTEVFEIQLKVAALSQERLNKQVEQIAWKERLSAPEPTIVPTLANGSQPFRSVTFDLQIPDDRRLQTMLREDAAAAAAEALETQIALCEQRLKDLATFEKSLEAKIVASSGVEVFEARLNGEKQVLAAIEAQLKELTTSSPSHGTVADVKFQAGDRVPGGSTIMEILDEQQTHVVAQIPSDKASTVHPGTKVTLVFPMNERRTGVVASLPPQTVSAVGKTEAMLPVKIEQTGKLWPKLAIGSRVSVHLQ